jgi:photosystem II stability/assembly factor-like uncharacterized protein
MNGASTNITARRLAMLGIGLCIAGGLTPARLDGTAVPATDIHQRLSQSSKTGPAASTARSVSGRIAAGATRDKPQTVSPDSSTYHDDRPAGLLGSNTGELRGPSAPTMFVVQPTVSRMYGFDTSVGSAAPPPTLGGHPMTAFGPDPSPLYTDVTSVAGPCSAPGSISFSSPLIHMAVGSGWATWSHGYIGDVYYTNGALSVTITMPPDTCALHFYAEPNPFAVHTFTVTADDGSSTSFQASGSAGAAYCGVFGEAIASITVTSDVDFAIGEFGLACVCEPVWLPLHGPYGAYVADVCVSVSYPNVVYAALNGAGVYVSGDSGSTWLATSTGLAPSGLGAWVLAPDPFDAQRLYLGTWLGGIFTSSDEGATWQSVPTPWMHALDICVCPLTPSTLYAAMGQPMSTDLTNVAKSTDWGETWEEAGQGLIPNVDHWAIAVDPYDANVVYTGTSATADNHFFKSADGGQLWIDMSVGLDPARAINAIVVDPNMPSTLYVATDNGVFKRTEGLDYWFPTSDGIGNMFTRDLAIDPGDPQRLYVATWGGLYRTIDAGGTWDDISVSFSSRMVKSVDLNPAWPEEVFAGVWGGIYRSDNGGDTWSFSDAGLPQDLIVSDEGLAVDAADPEVIYVGTYGGGVARSVDGGETFEYVNLGLSTGYCIGLYASPDQAGTLFCVVKGGDAVYKTTDGAESWATSGAGLPRSIFFCGAFDRESSDVFYLGSNQGVYKTADGGASWFSANVGLTDLVIRDIATGPGETIYVATNDTGIFKSTDGGDSWFSSSAGLSDMRSRGVAISPGDPSTLFAGTVAGVFKSTDGGASWLPSTTGLADVEVRRLLVHPADTQIVFAQSRLAGMFISTDGGATWGAWSDGLTSPMMSAMRFDNPASPTAMLIGTGDGPFKAELPAFGACCFTSGVCAVSSTAAECSALGGQTWVWGLDCDPNPCEAAGLPGDLNCDGLINGYDIDPFVLALSSAPDFAAYYAAYPACDAMLADVNGDGAVNGYDIDPFVACLTGGCP